MSGEATVITERDGDVLVVTLNRPERLNALNASMLHALTGVWVEAAAPEIRAVVVTGAGRGFCAGADLRADRNNVDRVVAPLRHTYNPHITTLAALDKPVIAAVNGAAAGAGLALACAADIRIASEHAQFVPAFSKIGLVPDSGSTYFVPRILGYPRAFEWFASGAPADAWQALAWNLVSEVVPADELMWVALKRAHHLADMPGLGVSLTKRALNQASHRLLLEQLDLEANLQPVASSTPDRAEAIARVIESLGNAHSETTPEPPTTKE